MQRLVARTGRPKFEFIDAVARETGVRVAVDESGDGAEAASVQLFLSQSRDRVRKQLKPHCAGRIDHADS